jgi:diguanylate cyclase (GGDEF)-like protein
VRSDGLAFRFGGEEFLLLIPGVNSEQASQRAEQILETIRTARIGHEGTALGPVTASMGLATFPEHGGEDALVRAADAALLRAKQQGRDRLVTATVNRRDTKAA